MATFIFELNNWECKCRGLELQSGRALSFSIFAKQGGPVFCCHKRGTLKSATQEQLNICSVARSIMVLKICSYVKKQTASAQLVKAILKFKYNIVRRNQHVEPYGLGIQ